MDGLQFNFATFLSLNGNNIEVYTSTEEYKHYISIVSCDLNLNVFFHISNRHTVE